MQKVSIIPKFVEFIPEKSQMIEKEIYISEEYHTAVHLCLCGCKNQSVTRIKETEWTIWITNSKDVISMTPSILNNNCPNKSHYIITNNIANFV